jgi:hypothetical protein
VDALGLGWLNDLLLAVVLQPVAALAYPRETQGGAPLDYRHAFLVGYGPAGHGPAHASAAASPPAERRPPPSLATRSALVRHTDNSEVTLNVGLGRDGFGGGEVVFGRVRGETAAAATTTTNGLSTDGAGGVEDDAVAVVKPVVGRGLVHLGRQLHEVRHKMGGVGLLAAGREQAHEVLWG